MNPQNPSPPSIEDPNASSLEAPATVVEQDNSGSDTNPTQNQSSTSSPDQPPTPPDQPTTKKRGFSFLQLFHKFNMYLAAFIFLIIIACIIAYVAIRNSQSSNQSNAYSATQLSTKTLSQLQNNNVTVGDVKQTLNVEANANFAGSVLVRNNLDVAGIIKVGGPLSVSGLDVAGSSKFDQLQANNVSVSGNINLQGQLNVQQNLSVAGGGTFGGPISAPSITINTLSLSQDLQLSRHIDAGGSTPRSYSGGAVGNGGTVTISGSDTAGTVTVGIGSSPSTGTLASVVFAAPYNITPFVIITPVGSSAAGLQYYITRSSTSFTINVNIAPTAGTHFSFDYMVME